MTDERRKQIEQEAIEYCDRNPDIDLSHRGWAKQDYIAGRTAAEEEIERLKKITEFVAMGDDTRWTFMPQKGTANHCHAGQIFDATGKAIAMIEPTENENEANKIGNHIINMQSRIRERTAEISALKQENERLQSENLKLKEDMKETLSWLNFRFQAEKATLHTVQDKALIREIEQLIQKLTK